MPFWGFKVASPLPDCLGEDETQKREKSLALYYDTIIFFQGLFPKSGVIFSTSEPERLSGQKSQKTTLSSSSHREKNNMEKLKALRFATEAPSLC